MKKIFYIKLILLTFFLMSFFITSLILVFLSDIILAYKYIIIYSLCLFITSNFVILIYYSLNSRKNKEFLLNKFDFYIENEISKTDTGLLILDDYSKIIWSSKFIEKRVGKKLVGKKLENLSKNLQSNYENHEKNFIFLIDEIYFETIINYFKKLIILKDITNKVILEKKYKEEKLIIGEMEIDNFRQLQTTLSEEKIFKVQAKIIKMLDDLSKKFNVTYRQYIQGKFWIFTNNKTLKLLKEENFDFLNKLKNPKNLNDPKITFSLGFGIGSIELKDLIKLAKDALLQSLSRGGNQITLNIENQKFEYFGSKSETNKTISRVKINQISQLLERKINNKSISRVIIYGHALADLDSIGSSLAIKSIVESFDKKAYIQNLTIDGTSTKVLNESFTKKEINEIFVSPNKANKLTNKNDTIVILVDNSSLERTENIDAFDKADMDNVFIFDHHRTSMVNKNFKKDNVYIDPLASSTSEIITEVIQFMNKKIEMDKKIIQFLLNGIYLDTNQFTKATSSKTFEAASWLEQRGARSDISSRILKIPESQVKLISLILSNAKEIKPGFFLSKYNEEVPEDIISLAADEMLRVEKRKASFVIAKISNKKKIKMSARGIDENVQIIAESVGGGGHFSSAAATSDEEIDVFVDNLIQSIVSIKGDT